MITGAAFRACWAPSVQITHEYAFYRQILFRLFNKWLLAHENGLAWLGYMWSPTRAASTLDLTRLVEPSCAVGQNPEDGCGYDDSRVRIAVHPSLVAEAADLVELFRKWDFKQSTQFVAGDCLNEADKDFNKAAICYLKKEQAVWTQWVTKDATQKVREALNAP